MILQVNSMLLAKFTAKHQKFPQIFSHKTKAVIDLYEPVSDSILKPDLVSLYK